jgi:hypothetical protein
MPIATSWNSRCELLPSFSTVKAKHPRRILAGAQDVITVRYHSLRAWFRRMADFGLWMSPQNPHKSASAAGGPRKNSTYKTALPGTRRHGR